ncbi:MAG: TonB-dependent receptor [Bacteroidetes bacterium]|nr:TonB-dependent receptor [Bacteroidota bacterium]
MHIRITSFLLAFLLLYGYSIANNLPDGDVTISGFIKDASSGEELIGTNIILYLPGDDNSYFRGVASNRYGFYALPGIASGTYYIEFRNVGYRTHRDTLIISVSSGSLKYDAFLDEEDILLSEVTVSAQRESKAIVSEIKLTHNMLKSLPTMSGEVDIFKSLVLLPGVQTATEISSGLYIRGGSPDQTLTLVDNMMVYNPSHLGNFASTFNSNAVQDIILVKGAYPAEYGGRLSSVLDIKLRSGTKEKEKANFGLGTLNSYVTLEGPLNDKSTFLLSGRSMYYDLVQKTVFSDSENPYYNFHDLNAKFTYELSDKDALSLSAFYSRDKLYSPDNAGDLEYEMSWLNGSVSLNWMRSSEKYISNTAISYVQYQFDSKLDNGLQSIQASDYFASSKLSDVNLSSDFEIFLHENHKMKTGLQIFMHNYDLIASDIYHNALENDSDLRTKILSIESSAFMQLESQITAQLKSNVGTRIYYFKNQKRVNIEPRVSFMYSFDEAFSVKAAYSLTHQFIHLMFRNDISLPTDFWFPSTKEISPSRSQQFVVGLESELFDKQYLVSVEAYYRDMKDIYEFKENAKFSPSTPIVDLLTKGQGEAYGIEFFLNKTVGSFTGWIGYTYSFTRRLFDDLNIGRIYYPRYDRRNDISVVLSYKMSKNFSLSATWNYASGQGMTMPYAQYQGQKIGNQTGSELLLFYSERNGHKLPDYHKLDISASYDFQFDDSELTVYMSLYNVYNRQNIFAQFVSFEEETNPDTQESVTTPKIKQIVLFPFIPTFGIKYNL